MFSLELIMALHLICLRFYQLITNSSPNPMGISTHPSAVSLLETLFRSFLALSGCGFFWVCCQTVPPPDISSHHLGTPSLLCWVGFTLPRVPPLPTSTPMPFLLWITPFSERDYEEGGGLRFSMATNVFILTLHLNNPELDIEPWNGGNFPSES